MVVGLPFRLLHLCLKGSNGKSERSPGKSVARTIRCAFVCYYLVSLLSARSSERAFFSPDYGIATNHKTFKGCALAWPFFISGSRESPSTLCW
ncbi:TPA: hypothetical protein MI390_25375 [Klebsiella pneumoniae]|nr:hypothetical protein [Klebsiella pneumoniae]